MMLGCQWNVISLYNFFLQKNKWVSNKKENLELTGCADENLLVGIYIFE